MSHLTIKHFFNKSNQFQDQLCLLFTIVEFMHKGIFNLFNLNKHEALGCGRFFSTKWFHLGSQSFFDEVLYIFLLICRVPGYCSSVLNSSEAVAHPWWRCAIRKKCCQSIIFTFSSLLDTDCNETEFIAHVDEIRVIIKLIITWKMLNKPFLALCPI